MRTFLVQMSSSWQHKNSYGTWTIKRHNFFNKNKQTKLTKISVIVWSLFYMTLEDDMYMVNASNKWLKVFSEFAEVLLYFRQKTQTPPPNVDPYSLSCSSSPPPVFISCSRLSTPPHHATFHATRSISCGAAVFKMSCSGGDRTALGLTEWWMVGRNGSRYLEPHQQKQPSGVSQNSFLCFVNRWDVCSSSFGTAMQ